ncbi:MAG: hypothetical protein JST16_18355 [Bdellovibrionales bacterium]|nr:hypothetical protein [Bdellovibrionales bacterium]
MGFTNGQTATATVTASSPASFNSHYDKGVDISISLGGEAKSYRFASKVTGNLIEVGFEEDPGTTRSGSGAGFLDLDNGVIRVESRMARLTCTESGSCGWNRHVRLYSTLAMSGTDIQNPKDVEFLYSNISAPPGQSVYDGLLITASGDLSASGIKAREFHTAVANGMTDLQTISNWAEVSNSNCYTSSSDTATTCGTGLPKMTTNTKFVMADTGYTAPATWFEAQTSALSFTSVSADSDTP